MIRWKVEANHRKQSPFYQNIHPVLLFLFAAIFSVLGFIVPVASSSSPHYELRFSNHLPRWNVCRARLIYAPCRFLFPELLPQSISLASPLETRVLQGKSTRPVHPGIQSVSGDEASGRSSGPKLLLISLAYPLGTSIASCSLRN